MVNQAYLPRRPGERDAGGADARADRGSRIEAHRTTFFAKHLRSFAGPAARHVASRQTVMPARSSAALPWLRPAPVGLLDALANSRVLQHDVSVEAYHVRLRRVKLLVVGRPPARWQRKVNGIFLSEHVLHLHLH